MTRRSKACQFISLYVTDNSGYDVIWTAEKIAQYLRCSVEEIFDAALNDETARTFLLNTVRNLKNGE